MGTVISKWGNSLALRIPCGLAEDVHLVEGSEVDIRVDRGALVITPAPKRFDIETLMEGYRPEHRHHEIDWGEGTGAVGKEVW